MELDKSHTKIINVNTLEKMLLFFFLFFSSLHGLRLGHETGIREGAERKTTNNCKHKCYVALCLGMLLLFCVLKGSPD